MFQELIDQTSALSQGRADDELSRGMGPLALAPMLPKLITAFHSNLTDVVQFTGIPILVLGFSNSIWYVSLHDDANMAGDEQLQGSDQGLRDHAGCKMIHRHRRKDRV